MENKAVFQVNYFVGTMLAEVGELQVTPTHLTFTPTGMIEKIMGAKSIVIPLSDIISFDYTGGLARTVKILTPQRIHKFEGSATSGFGDLLVKLLPGKAARRPSQVQMMFPRITPQNACEECTEQLTSGLSFCTRCGATPSGLCSHCQKLTEPSWAFCGFCGTKVASYSNPIEQRRVA